jgi:hypothetical protein
VEWNGGQRDFPPVPFLQNWAAVVVTAVAAVRADRRDVHGVLGRQFLVLPQEEPPAVPT